MTSAENGSRSYVSKGFGGAWPSLDEGGSSADGVLLILAALVSYGLPSTWRVRSSSGTEPCR